jgi:mannitol/fructose-specific phosphotransferase system IIA component (Ntr-type)
VTIPPEHTFDLEATERYDAIREILRHLVRVGAIPTDAEEPLFAAIRQREEVMSTGVGYGAAFPHAVSELVSQRIVARGRLRTDVNFDSLDGKPVKEIFLLILPKSA